MTEKDIDHYYIGYCLQLAAKGRYSAHPNPMVGAILVKNNRIIGKGFHKVPGSPHAEQIAIKQAGHAAKNATLYINLEPCCHHGRTPPCSDLIIKSKIKRVVISSLDPNPLVNSNSIKQLRKSGVIVKVGIMKKDGMNLNRGFMSRFIKKRPFVIVKSGISLDGKTSLYNGVSKWITSEYSRIDVQYERSMASIILTTSNTVIADNPLLTVRLPYLLKKISKQPDLAVLDSKLRIPLTHKIFSITDRKIYLFTSIKLCKNKYKSNVEIIYISSINKKINLKRCFSILNDKDVNNILVEAGSILMSSLFKDDLVDELSLIHI